MAKRYFKPHPWTIAEDRHQPKLNEFQETIFFLGNGYMGVRGVPEEGFSGDPKNTMPTTYLGPIYDIVPAGSDRHVTNVDHCSIMVHVPNWFGLELTLGGRRFDPLAGTVLAYRRELDMKAGVVTRTVRWKDDKGRTTDLVFTRFVSQDDIHLGGLRLEVTPLDWRGTVSVSTGVDGSHCDRQRAVKLGAAGGDGAMLCVETLNTEFETAMVMRLLALRDGKALAIQPDLRRGDKTVGRSFRASVGQGQTLRIDKLVCVCTSRDMGEKDAPGRRASAGAAAARKAGFDDLLARHADAWQAIWDRADVEIAGDTAAQQGVRFCVFNMNQNYAGNDPRVNMSAKGLSGPGYGGLYWWDSEAYFVPFFLYTQPAKSRNLLQYRHGTIQGAKNKARHYGFEGAMWPWVTIDGEERSFDWEYGMLEQHVGAAVPWAVRQYMEATSDQEFLRDHGAELVIETARFWASRVHWAEHRKAYVIAMVTGPDEYAVAQNNNFYTNFMAKRCCEYAGEVVATMKKKHPAAWKKLARKLRFRDAEVARFRDVAKRMYLPYEMKLGINVQDDGFLDRTPFDMSTLPKNEWPTHKHWGWDKLMRSQAIKQPDVLMAEHLENDCFSRDQKMRDYKFYEPRTTHESSLSPCVHSMLASELGLADDAFRYYLRTARLDLDDVNHNANQGLHTACLAGAWMSVTVGFAGMRLVDDHLCFRPRLPMQWKRLSFKVTFRDRWIRATLTPGRIAFELDGAPLTVKVNDKPVKLTAGETVVKL